MRTFAGSLLLGALRGTLIGVATVTTFITAVYIAGEIRAAGLLFLAISALFAVVGTLIHELGHAVAAWSAGWRVHRIVVGRLGYAPRTGKWSFERQLPKGRDVGGWVVATPQPQNASRSGELAYLLGGCVANLLAAFICLVVAELAVSNPTAAALARGFAVVSIVMAIVNLDPWRNPDRQHTDGRQVLTALARRRSGVPPGPADEALARVLAELLDEHKPHPADLDVLQRMPLDQAVRGPTGDILKTAAIFSGNLVWLTRLILESERQGATLETHELCALALAAAVIDGDAAAGRHHLERVSAAEHESPQYLRALAAVEHVGGDSAGAKATVARLHRIARSADWGDADDHALFKAIENGSPFPRIGYGAVSDSPRDAGAAG